MSNAGSNHICIRREDESNTNMCRLNVLSVLARHYMLTLDKNATESFCQRIRTSWQTVLSQNQMVSSPTDTVFLELMGECQQEIL